MTIKNSNLVKEGDWRERCHTVEFGYETDGDAIEKFVESEKQLSYQEGVEKAIEIARGELDMVKQTPEPPYRSDYINKQNLLDKLSNLKEEGEL